MAYKLDWSDREDERGSTAAELLGALGVYVLIVLVLALIYVALLSKVQGNPAAPQGAQAGDLTYQIWSGFPLGPRKEPR